MRVEEFIFLWDFILVPAAYFLALVLQRLSQPQLRANTVAVGAYMADDAECAALPHGLNNAINDFRVRLHGIKRWMHSPQQDDHGDGKAPKSWASGAARPSAQGKGAEARTNEWPHSEHRLPL